VASKRRPLVVEVNAFNQRWLAGLMRWKHLDRAIDVAKKLHSLNKPYAFRVRNIDTGEIAWSSETEVKP
jgi:hypothetical protein